MEAQDIADLVAAFQQAAQAAAVAAQAQAQAQAQADAAVGAPPAVQFACTPALAQPALLDYSSASGAKIFSKATEALPTTFSLRVPNIKVFLNELTTQQQTFGWENIMRVNAAPDGQPNEFCNIVEQHGRCSFENVERHALTFIDANNRDAQNDFQVFKCLNATVDEESKKRLANDRERYCLGANDTPCGIAYLKLALTKAEVDARATATHVRTNLTMLITYMTEVAQQDILKFNTYVNEQMDTLTSRGEDSSDILVNVFKGYDACTDPVFHKYIVDMKDRWEEGGDLTYEELMRKAEVKYSSRLLDNQWNAPSREQTEIIALRAQLQASIETETKKRAKKPAAKQKSAPKKAKSDKGGKFTGKMAFRNSAPKNGEPHVKDIDGDEWKYCTHHKKWGRHTVDECHAHQAIKAREGTDTATGGVTAQQATIDEYDSEDEQE